MIKITQGDTATIKITCTTGQGQFFNLTAAVFETRISAATGGDWVLPDAKHTIIDASAGRVNIALAASDTAAFQPGSGREIVTRAVQGSNITTFHGIGGLEVLLATPVQ